jgi:hypothetical protein
MPRNCEMCGDELVGRQKRFCCKEHRTAFLAVRFTKGKSDAEIEKLWLEKYYRPEYYTIRRESVYGSRVCITGF